MFIFKRPVVAVLAPLMTAALFVAMDALFRFSAVG